MTYMPWEQKQLKIKKGILITRMKKHLETETGLETNLEIVLEIHKIKIEGYQKDPIGLEINIEKNSNDRSHIRARNGNDSKQKSNQHCEYFDQDGHAWKYHLEMHVNAKKTRRLNEMDGRDDDPSDTLNSMVSEDPISDDDLDSLIRNFSEMTELS